MDTASIGSRHTESVLARPGVRVVASRMPGSFRDDPTARPEFPAAIESPGGGSNGV